jgi:hypothetical protein
MNHAVEQGEHEMTRKSTIGCGACLIALSLALGCGGSKTPAKSADDNEAPADTAGDKTSPGSGTPAPGSSDDKSSKGNASPCSGFELDLMAALNESSCEVPNGKPDSKQEDMKDSLSVTATADTARVAPGGHANILVTYANKKDKPITLDFTIDPTPRFSVETYDLKSNKRVDIPAAPQPKLPAGMPPLEATQVSIARVTLAPNGKATVHVGWDAVKTRWAPEKLKGTPPEMGYPRVPAGNLSKGKFSLKVITPLTNVFEGVDHEVSAPRANIDVQ